MRTALISVVLLVFLVSPLPAAPQDGPQLILFTNVHVFDGVETIRIIMKGGVVYKDTLQ